MAGEELVPFIVATVNWTAKSLGADNVMGKITIAVPVFGFTRLKFPIERVGGT
jgi:hypothetical protein